jgi:hypothetical protein
MVMAELEVLPLGIAVRLRLRSWHSARLVRYGRISVGPKMGLIGLVWRTTLMFQQYFALPERWVTLHSGDMVTQLGLLQGEQNALEGV